MCALGGRLIAKSRILENGTLQCHKNITGPLYHLYCGQNKSLDACDFFNANNVTEFAAIPGLASNMFYGKPSITNTRSVSCFVFYVSRSLEVSAVVQC